MKKKSDVRIVKTKAAIKTVFFQLMEETGKYYEISTSISFIKNLNNTIEKQNI